MITIDVRYLCGWAMASDVSERSRAEWPPHPRRVFLALAAAHFESGADSAERAALEWLEALPPPAMRASQAFHREAVTTFVPVNDDITKKWEDPRPAVEPEPFGRPRQARTFPVAVPHEEVVSFCWAASTREAARHRTALGRLCEKVTSVGQSASLVQMWVCTDAIEANLIPSGNGSSHRLRVPAPGLLCELEERYQRGQRPTLGIFAGYAPPSPTPEEAAPGTVFAPDMALLQKTSGSTIDLENALAITAVLRRAVIAAGPQPSPAYLSGHELDGERSLSPHVAFLAMPDVGHPHADGHLMGVAVALPLCLRPEERRACLRALAAVPRLHLGRLGEWQLEPPELELAPRALRASTWTGPSRRWASVTPVVLHRFPKRPGDAERILSSACEHVDLPPPARVTVAESSLVSGVPLAAAFPPIPSPPPRPRRWHQHAVVEFSEPVRGPLLLGAGRYRGYGLMRPVPERR